MKASTCTGAVLLMTVVLALPAAAAGVAIPVPAGSRVQLLQSNTVAPRARRCLTRLREELTAGGFQVTISEFGAGGDTLWMEDPPSPRDGSLATITLIGNPEDGPAELWIVDGAAGGRAAVRRLVVPAGSSTHDDEVLAIRTLEFLRASALELARAPTATATPAPTAPLAVPVAVAAPEHARAAASPLVPPAARGPFSFELGLSLLAASLSLEPAYLPLARLRAEVASLLEARITVAGLGTRPQLARSTGTATVGQTLGLVEMRVAFRRGRTLRPAVGVGGGVLLVQVDGAGSGSYEGRGGRAWAGLLDVSAGLTIALGRRLGVAIDAHGQVAAPYPSVRFSGEEAARIDRPALLTSLTLVTAL